MKKRLLAGIISLCMVVSLIPTSVFAAEPETKKVCAEGCTLEADHDGDCKLPKECVVGCTLQEGHDGDCVLPQKCEPDCTLEEGHDGECVLAKECDPDCTLEEGHEGDCVLPTKCTEEGCNLEFNHEGDHQTAETVTGEIEADSVVVSSAFSLRTATLAAQSESIITEEALRNAINNANTGDEITLEDNIELNSTLTIDKSVTINGNSKVITYNGSEKAIDVHANNVTIKNVTVEASDKSKVPVQFYNVTGGELDTVKINGKSSWGVALNVNASTVTVNNLDLSDKGVNVCVGEAAEIQGKTSRFDGTFKNASVIYADEGDCRRGNIEFGNSVEEWAVAKIEGTGGRYYCDTLETAIVLAKDGDTVTMLADWAYPTNGTGLLNITKSITLDGAGHKITGFGSRGGNDTTLAINYEGSDEITVTLKNLTIDNDAYLGRPIETRGNITRLNIENCKLYASGTGTTQVLTIGGNQSTPAYINIFNSVFEAGTGGYPIIMFNPVEMNIEDSSFEGYCSLYFKGENGSEGSHGSVVKATNSKFDAPNVHDSADGWNNFGAFVFEDDNVNLTLDSCTINAKENSSALQGIICGHSQAVRKGNGYFVTLKGNTLAKGKLLFDNGWNNEKCHLNIESGNFELADWKIGSNEKAFHITGGTFNLEPKVSYVANGYEAVQISNYYEVGEHKIVSVAKVAPNCGSKGVAAHYKCTFCGKLYSDAAGNTEVTSASLVIPATGNHNYGAWQVSSQPTCTTAGSNKSVCSVCGHERYSPIAATGHSYGSDGRCTVCGDYDATKVVTTPPAASTTTPATPAPAKPATTPETAETTPAPVENAKPETADTTITKVEASEEVVEAVKETVKVEEGTAKVEAEAIEKVIEVTEEGKEVVLPLTQVTDEVVNKAEVSADALEKVAEKEADVVIQLTDVTVKLDAVAIAAVAEQAQGKNIEIRAVKTETVTLTEKQQDALADKETAIVVTAQIFADGEYIGDFKGGTATIMLPFTPEEGRAAEDYKVYFVDDDGSLTPVAAEYVDGHMVFTTGHFSDYAIVYEKAEAVEDSESDTEVVITPEEASEGTSLPIIPIVVVIAIIVIGGIVLVMRRKKEE